MSAVLDIYPWLPTKFDFVCTEQDGREVVCHCPLKDHKRARVRFALGEGNRLIFKCMHDCPKLEILRAVGLRWSDCYPEGKMPRFFKQEEVARYPYHNELRQVLYEVVRKEPGRKGTDKDFYQRRYDPSCRDNWNYKLGDVRRVLYHLPELLAAKRDVPVFKCEGEKDCDTLRALGFLATTSVCGASAPWLDSYTQTLAGRHVVVIEDADGAGKRHANEVCGSLMTAAASVRRVNLSPAKDVTAFIYWLRANEGLQRNDLRKRLEEQVNAVTRWVPVSEVV